MFQKIVYEGACKGNFSTARLMILSSDGESGNNPSSRQRKKARSCAHDNVHHQVIILAKFTPCWAFYDFVAFSHRQIRDVFTNDDPKGSKPLSIQFAQ